MQVFYLKTHPSLVQKHNCLCIFFSGNYLPPYLHSSFLLKLPHIQQGFFLLCFPLHECLWGFFPRCVFTSKGMNNLQFTATPTHRREYCPAARPWKHQLLLTDAHFRESQTTFIVYMYLHITIIYLLPISVLPNGPMHFCSNRTPFQEGLEDSVHTPCPSILLR